MYFNIIYTCLSHVLHSGATCNNLTSEKHCADLSSICPKLSSWFTMLLLFAAPLFQTLMLFATLPAESHRLGHIPQGLTARAEHSLFHIPCAPLSVLVTKCA